MFLTSYKQHTPQMAQYHVSLSQLDYPKFLGDSKESVCTTMSKTSATQSVKEKIQRMQRPMNASHHSLPSASPKSYPKIVSMSADRRDEGRKLRKSEGMRGVMCTENPFPIILKSKVRTKKM